MQKAQPKCVEIKQPTPIKSDIIHTSYPFSLYFRFFRNTRVISASSHDYVPPEALITGAGVGTAAAAGKATAGPPKAAINIFTTVIKKMPATT